MAHILLLTCTQSNKNKKTLQGRSFFRSKSHNNGWNIMFALFIFSSSNIGNGFDCNVSVKVIINIKKKNVNSAGSCLFHVIILSDINHLKVGAFKSFFYGSLLNFADISKHCSCHRYTGE